MCVGDRATEGATRRAYRETETRVHTRHLGRPGTGAVRTQQVNSTLAHQFGLEAALSGAGVEVTSPVCRCVLSGSSRAAAHMTQRCRPIAAHVADWRGPEGR